MRFRVAPWLLIATVAITACGSGSGDTGVIWGVVDFDADGLPEILTLDPQGASFLWTTVQPVGAEELVLADAFPVGGDLASRRESTAMTARARFGDPSVLLSAPPPPAEPERACAKACPRSDRANRWS